MRGDSEGMIIEGGVVEGGREEKSERKKMVGCVCGQDDSMSHICCSSKLQCFHRLDFNIGST